MKDPGGRPRTQAPECTVDGCDKKPNARNLCKTHYSRLLKHGDPLKGVAPVRKPCSIDGCDLLHTARGWCGTHYERWRRYGDPLHVKLPRLTPEPKAKPQPPGKCKIRGCDGVRTSRGWCNKHYRRWKRNGDPNVARKERAVRVVVPPKPTLIDPPEHLVAFLRKREARLRRDPRASQNLSGTSSHPTPTRPSEANGKSLERVKR